MMLIDSLVKGGRERRLIELLKSFSRLEYLQVSLVIFSKRVEYEEVYDLPVKIHFLERKPKKDPRVFFRFYKLCKKEQPDIIHSWGTMPSIYAIPTVKLLGIKFLNAIIADAPKNMSIFDERLFRARLTYPFSDRIVGNSKAGLKAYSVPKHKSQTVYNGFDFQRVSNLQAKESVIHQLKMPNGKIIGMVGAFFDRKDYHTFVEAAKLFLSKRRDTTFLAIGDGPNLDKVKVLAQQPPNLLKEEPLPLGSGIPKETPLEEILSSDGEATNRPPFRGLGACTSRILFPGLLHNVESVINTFDIGVLCTNSKVHGEGISNSILEYMVLGKPVIATEGGGTNEIVVDGETGFLIPSGQPAVLVDKMNFLLGNPAIALEMGQKGKERVYELFSLERMEKDYLGIYKEMFLGSELPEKNHKMNKPQPATHNS